MRKSFWLTSTLLVVVALFVGACAAPAAAPATGGDAEAAASPVRTVKARIRSRCNSNGSPRLSLRATTPLKAKATTTTSAWTSRSIPVARTSCPNRLWPVARPISASISCQACSLPANRAQIWSTSPRYSSAAPCARFRGKMLASKRPADLAGKKVAVWFGGNEFELLATLAKYGIERTMWN